MSFRGSWRLLVCASLFAGLAFAQETSQPPSAPSVSPPSGAAGAPHGEFFRSLTADQQEKYMKLVDEWAKLSPDERHQILGKFEQSRNLSAEQRDALRKCLDRFERMPADQRDHVLERMHRWQQMTPEQREKLRQREQEMRAKAEQDLQQHLAQLGLHPGPDQMKWIHQYYFQKRGEIGRQVMRRARELRQQLPANASEEDKQKLRQQLQAYRQQLEQEARPDFEQFARNPHPLAPSEFHGEPGRFKRTNHPPASASGGSP